MNRLFLSLCVILIKTSAPILVSDSFSMPGKRARGDSNGEPQRLICSRNPAVMAIKTLHLIHFGNHFIPVVTRLKSIFQGVEKGSAVSAVKEQCYRFICVI